ncbi:NAD(P)H-quinone oxidoreductase subunit 3 [Candidatus Profftia lariciata]|uniref:NADH-quinone oxidoreductase subunit A n=1 Tax=Candidatus Profftia lariciata TaxID=1987921 RepID=UPI001D01E30A|nr:NADH-quinone oxidoreductase subunit A [Candidatus Profftia lariciata]UDG81662.1 NAD(P)H-quinone oxidoreductase subunit 3 [Candidatus Profftia lariciata]
MLKNIEVISHYWAFTIFIMISIGLPILMLFGTYILGEKSYTKNIPYESGIDSVGSARLRFSVKFYLVAMFFVIFDVEALYLYAWSISIRENGWVGFIEVTIFIIMLLISLFYLTRIGGLDWTPIKSKRLKKKT